MSTMSATVQENLPANASTTHRNDTLGYMAVELPAEASDQAVAAVERALSNRPGVQYVEENATYEIQVAPNDPYYDSQYAPQQVNAPAAWETTTGSTDVTVAVIDTGAQYDHPDLQSLYASDPGYDFVDNDGNPYPNAGASHGTHVSGCASADTDNNRGVAGISDSRLVNARCLGGNGSGSLADIADGVQWAADQGADIINMSLGGGGYNQTMKNAVQYAANRDVLIVCAAGNDSRGSVSYPSAYSECVSVSALDSYENLASFSNYGDGVEVAAPGVNVYSTYPTDSYAELSGTSMASPVAAGVAALGLAANPGLSASQLRQRLKDTAVDVGLPATQQGSGRVDAANIVGGGGGGGGGEQPEAKIEYSPTSPDVGERVDFDGSASSDPDGGSIQSYYWESSTGGSANGQSVYGSWDQEQVVTLTLTVTDDEDQTDTTSVDVQIGGGGGGDEPGEPELYCGTATNDEHVSAGRAYKDFSWRYYTYLYFAEGSGEYIGYQGGATTTLSEESSGYFVPTSSC
jgi:serine protease